MELKKQLRFVDVLSMAFGAIIGWGCFMLPGNLFLPQAGPLGTVLALLLGSLMIIVIASSYSYLIKEIPGAGGEFNYIKTAFGKKAAFFAAWFLILSYCMIVPLNGTAIGLLFRFIVPEDFLIGKLYSIAGWDVYLGEILLSTLVITTITIFNYRGIEKSGLMQTIVCFVLVISAVILSIMVFTADTTTVENLTPLFQTEGKNWYEGVLAIAAVAPWAFMGFDCIPQMSEEYNFPHHKARTLMYMSIIFAAIMYILINTVTAIAIPWKNLIDLNPGWATKDAVSFAVGKAGVILLVVSLLGGIISGINSFFLLIHD